MTENKGKSYIGTPTGVKTRSGEILLIGDRIETVQGTKFTVVVNRDGWVCIEDDEGNFFELKPYMSPNIWKINQKQQGHD